MQSPARQKSRTLVIGVSARALAESAVRGGCPVVALDAFGDRDLSEIAECYSLQRDFHLPYNCRALYKASRFLNFDSIAYTSNLENHPEILELFARSRKLIGNPAHAVRRVRNWADLFPRLHSAGFSYPYTVFSRDEPLPEIECRWLLKPVLTGGGRGISFYRGEDFTPGQQMLQQFIEGKQCSASFVGNGTDAVLLGIAEQLIGDRWFGADGFRYCGSILPAPDILSPDEGTAILRQARAISRFLVREYGLVGVNGFDFIVNKKKIFLTEVNPRYSASMELMERAYGIPVFRIHCEAAVNGKLPEFDLESHLSGRMFFGKSILFCERDCPAPETLDCPVEDLRDIPVHGEQLKKGGPVCTVFVRRKTRDETVDELVRRCARIREQIYG